MKWTFLILFVAGGIYFLAESITNRKKSSRWVSLTNGMIGFLLLAKGFSKLLDPSQMRSLFTSTSAGLILGMFFCLGISGNIGKKKNSQPGNGEVRKRRAEKVR